MGRHRSDPRGLARILVAAVAVVLALALLVVGGMALVNAISGQGDKATPSTGPTTPSASTGRGVTKAASPGRGTGAGSAATSSVPLVIRVIGPATTVVIRVAGTGDVLQSGVLATGESRKYPQAPLNVVANNGASLQVLIYGKIQAAKPSGERGQWFVPAR